MKRMMMLCAALILLLAACIDEAAPSNDATTEPTESPSLILSGDDTSPVVFIEETENYTRIVMDGTTEVLYQNYNDQGSEMLWGHFEHEGRLFVFVLPD